MRKILIILSAWLFIIAPLRAGALVDLNNATQAQLESVKGIGPAKARAIIDYRKRTGPFRNVAELKKVTGFGEKSIARIRPVLTVGPPRAQAAEARRD